MNGTFRWRARMGVAPRKPQLPVFFLTAALLFACGKEPVSEEPAADLKDIDRVEELRTIFNQDAGVVRLVLLLSPT